MGSLQTFAATREVAGGVGKSMPNFSGRNDHIIHRWQVYAEMFSTKTADRHLAAIRLFEASLKEKCFASLTREDVAAVRGQLLKTLNGNLQEKK